MTDYDRRITDQKPEYPIGDWPFVFSAILWGVILGLAWVW